MNYIEARQYIDEAMTLGSVLGLSNIRELLNRIDNPQDKIRIIHVAGTNGKGSTIAYLNSIFMEAGYKVGRYISPAVFSYRERMQINRVNISEEEFADILSDMSMHISKMLADGHSHPTAFEIETAIAYEYFYRNNCDVAIIETGLGGLEDATNVIKSPLACVITDISLDHTGVLGDTLEEIAMQKAGIIMEKSRVVLSNQREAVVSVVEDITHKMDGELYITGKATDIVCEKGMTSFTYDEERYDTHMLGTYQIRNAINAIETARILGVNEFDISGKDIYMGIKNAVWAGRFEKICDKPEVYIDGAHNPEAADRFVETLDKYFSGVKKIFIMGVLADKDYEEVVSKTVPYAEHIITITPDNIRALDGAELANVTSQYNANVEYQKDMKKAVKLAVKKAKKVKGMVIAFGSLSYLDEIKNIVKG
ncbi:MAG: bifunctional folylpolyglutamate synthase/dihydrofolate synthase [Lachnospiraceae bacterium]|nr:bifunctional folylpolyglutamate synthase/dihydrofolate synthase [Lachnospiraceae bacterium]